MKKKCLKVIVICILINFLLVLLINTYKVYGATYNQVTYDAKSSNRNGIDSFPDSYKALLNKLVENTGHTNWKFKALYTDLDWNEVINNETDHLHNTISIGHPASWYDSCWKQGDSNYYCASKDIISYYMDPRNFLTEITIFQFLDLSYDSSMNVNQIQSAVRGTFLDKSYNGESYAQIICEAARQSGESAFSILTRIFQELGNGSSTPYIVSGKDSTYPNTYNFYNYGASDGDGNVSRGLKYAYNAGWRNPKTAIIEGAKVIAGTYTKAGQVNKYLYKFDVVGSNKSDLYRHQYMTNVEDPNSQSQILYGRYNNNNLLDKNLTFVIPVYKNMPSYVKLPPNSETKNLYYVSSNYTDIGFRDANGNTIQYKTGPWQEVGRLGKDAVVSMIDLNATKMLGLQFSKVSYNGIVGYVATKYLSPVNNNSDINSTQKEQYVRPVGQKFLGNEKSSDSLIRYSAQLEDIGWTKWAKDGETIGTIGEERRLETLNIALGDKIKNTKIQYRTHVENIGWQDWVSESKNAGTVGEGKRVEAFEIKLNNYEEYDVKYRAHVQDIGWQDWKKNGETAGTEGQSKRIEAIEIKLEKKNKITQKETIKGKRYLGTEKSSESLITYSAQLENIGWTQWAKDGETIGTIGEDKRLETIKIELNNSIKDLKIQYRTHVENNGWMNWVSEGKMSGTVGEGKRVEAIEIKLDNYDEYDIKYRAYVQDIGWQEWKKDGETAGTEGQSKRIEAVEIKLEEKSILAKSVNYISHIQDKGWLKWQSDGKESGTTGQSKRIEAIKIKLEGINNSKLTDLIQYKAHVQDIGWQDWKKDGEVAGTEGQSKRIEAIKIKLNEKIKQSIKYRVHVQDIGWQEWKKDGETAGTEGKSKRIEAIEIVITKK